MSKNLRILNEFRLRIPRALGGGVPINFLTKIRQSSCEDDRDRFLSFGSTPKQVGPFLCPSHFVAFCGSLSQFQVSSRCVSKSRSDSRHSGKQYDCSLIK